MSTGAMRHRFKLLAPVRVSDGQGGFTRTDGDPVYFYGSISNRGIQQRIINGSLIEVQEHKITTRYRTDISDGDKIQLGSRDFYVLFSPNHDFVNRFTTIYVREGGPL